MEQLLAERECEALITAYTHYVDFDEGARIPELFTEDGVWESSEATLNGRADLAGFFGARQDMVRKSRHVCSNVSVKLTGDETATGLCYFALYRHDGEKPRVPDLDNNPVILGEYRDEFVHTADGWRFKSRRAEVGFVRRSAL